MAYHGYVRYTGDLDVFVQMSETPVTKLTSVLREFGFKLPNIMPVLFLEKDRITRLDMSGYGW